MQQGAALRIRQDNGRVRALTVTKNIWYYATWIFNFHTWDTDRAEPFQQFGGVTVSSLLTAEGTPKPLPWHFCARALNHNLEFKVWATDETEPAWGDPSHGGRAPIPAGWDDAGATGWYVGHVPPTGNARFDDLTTSTYVFGNPPTTTTEPPTSEAPAIDGTTGGSVVVTPVG